MKYLFLIILIILLVGWPANALAFTKPLVGQDQLKSEGFSKYEVINPNSLLYQFKRIGEQIGGIFNKGNKKSYDENLLDKRYKELVYIVNNQKTGFLVESVERYNSLAGQIKSNYGAVTNQAQSYLKVLEDLRDHFPANSSHWMSIQQAIDVTRSLK